MTYPHFSRQDFFFNTIPLYLDASILSQNCFSENSSTIGEHRYAHLIMETLSAYSLGDCKKYFLVSSKIN